MIEDGEGKQEVNDVEQSFEEVELRCCEQYMADRNREKMGVARQKECESN